MRKINLVGGFVLQRCQYCIISLKSENYYSTELSFNAAKKIIKEQIKTHGSFAIKRHRCVFGYATIEKISQTNCKITFIFLDDFLNHISSAKSAIEAIVEYALVNYKNVIINGANEKINMLIESVGFHLKNDMFYIDEGIYHYRLSSKNQK